MAMGGECSRLCSGLRPDACLGNRLMNDAQCCVDWIGSADQGSVAGALD
jgi:hypothetical protein